MWAAKVELTGTEDRSVRQLMRSEALGVERHVLGMGDYKPFLRVV